MFSGAAFGEFGFSEQEYVALDTAAFEAFLEAVTEARCWLLELDALSLAPTDTVSAAFGDAGFGELGFADAGAGAGGGVQTLRFSTHGYTTTAADAPASTFYAGRLDGDLLVERQIAGRAGMLGLTQLYAEATLVNTDGGLDTVLRDYSLDGRRARLLVGRPTDAYADFGLVFTGVFQDAQVDLARLRIRLSDGAAKLARRVNETAYAGTGDLEGGDNLKGKFKPVAYGAAPNVSPPLVDTTRLIYQVHDGAVSDVPAVYDRGVSLTKGTDYASQADLLASAPSAGQYRVYPAGGYFRLGSTPAGTVTADVNGDAAGSYAVTTGDIVLRILTGEPALTSSEIDPASFSNLNTDSSATVGLYVGPEESRTCAEVIDELLAGVGAYGGFARQGAFTVGVLAAATGADDASYTESHIQDLAIEPLPAEVAPIIWRSSVAWQRNYTVQTDLAASVPAARVAFAAAPLRVAVEEDVTIKSRYLLAREYGPVEALYALEADALAEAARLFALWGMPRLLLRVRLPVGALMRDLGDVINLTHRRMGLSLGRSGRVIGQRITTNGAELKVLI